MKASKYIPSTWNHGANPTVSYINKKEFSL